MKKKFITGLLLLAITVMGFSTFTSCKDTDEDLYNKIESEQVSLSAALKALQDQLSQCSSNCSSQISTLETKLGELQTKLNALQTNGNGVATKDDLTNLQNTINQTIQSLSSLYATQQSVTDLGTLINQLTTRVQNLENKPEKPDQFTAEEAAALKSISPRVSEIIELLDNFKNSTGAFKDIEDLKTEYNTLQTQVNTSISSLTTLLNGADGQPGLIQTVETVTSQVADLQKWFENIGLTPAEFQNLVKQGQWVIDNKVAAEKVLAKINEIEALNGDALAQLNTYYGDLSKISEMYTVLFPKGTAGGEWWSYDTVMNNIKSNTTAIDNLKKDVDSILGRINDLVTSLILQATTNPVFGSVNTPFGINSMVLMAFYGHLATAVESFPVSNAADMGAECYETEAIDWSAITSDSYDLQNKNIINLNEDGMASLGNLWFTVNPATVNTLDLNGFSLVNSREDEPLVSLANVAKDDDTLLKFGVGSRAAGNGNGLYRAEAVVTPENLDLIKVNIESGLAQALKDAVSNRTAADVATLLKAVYAQLQNICDANALRYTYESISGKNADGSWATQTNKVYSNYGIAATAFKPLSFATLKGTSIRKLPTINHIELDPSLVDLKLKPFKIGNVTLNINLKISAIEISPVGETVITVKIPKKYDVNVDQTGTGEATLPDNWDTTEGMYDTITVDITQDLQKVINSVSKSIEEWINGVPGNEDKPGLNAQINSAIQSAIDEAFNGENGLVTSIEKQVNDMMGDIQDKLNSLLDQINNDYLGKVNSLIDKYQSVANRINKVLSDPNHYLQSVMFYRKANGGLGFLSTNPKQPTQFKGNGEAVSLWATTYSFETVCPAFKKIVGVTKVTKNGTTDCPELAKAANATLAKVLNGDQNRVALNVAGAKNGVYTYEIAYQALDFTGHTSTVKCYLQVVR